MVGPAPGKVGLLELGLRAGARAARGGDGVDDGGRGVVVDVVALGRSLELAAGRLALVLGGAGGLKMADFVWGFWSL